MALPGRSGPLSQFFATIDAHWFWKSLDLATVFAEGWLFLALLSPVLFRFGVGLLITLHVGVYLMLHIEFDSYILVYLPFFGPPVMAMVDRLPRLAHGPVRWGVGSDMTSALPPFPTPATRVGPPAD